MNLLDHCEAAGDGPAAGPEPAAPADRCMEQRMHRLNRLATVGQLACGVAHDFSNVLTIILANTEVLMLEVAASGDSRESLEMIWDAAQKAKHLIRRMLSLGRCDPVDVQVVELNALVSDFSRMLSLALGKSIGLDLRLWPSPGHVRADRIQMLQVLLNLVVNARDAMPEGGRFELATAHVDVGEGGSLDHLVPPGSYVLLSARDTGCGMDPATQLRIFEPFFTTKQPNKGTGLGLSLVHSIVRQCGGHIAVDSSPGGGSTFKIYLPRIG